MYEKKFPYTSITNFLKSRFGKIEPNISTEEQIKTLARERALTISALVKKIVDNHPTKINTIEELNSDDTARCLDRIEILLIDLYNLNTYYKDSCINQLFNNTRSFCSLKFNTNRFNRLMLEEKAKTLEEKDKKQDLYTPTLLLDKELITHARERADMISKLLERTFNDFKKFKANGYEGLSSDDIARRSSSIHKLLKELRYLSSLYKDGEIQNKFKEALSHEKPIDDNIFIQKMLMEKRAKTFYIPEAQPDENYQIDHISSDSIGFEPPR